MNSYFPCFYTLRPRKHLKGKKKTGIVLKWVIHKTQCMTCNTPERSLFCGHSLSPHYSGYCSYGYCIDFDEKLRESEMGWTCDSVTVDWWGIQSETVVVCAKQAAWRMPVTLIPPYHWDLLPIPLFLLRMRLKEVHAIALCTDADWH